MELYDFICFPAQEPAGVYVYIRCGNQFATKCEQMMVGVLNAEIELLENWLLENCSMKHHTTTQQDIFNDFSKLTKMYNI